MSNSKEVFHSEESFKRVSQEELVALLTYSSSFLRELAKILLEGYNKIKIVHSKPFWLG